MTPMEEMDARTNCDICRLSFTQFNGCRIGCFRTENGKAVLKECICPACDESMRLSAYHRTKYIDTKLMMAASMASVYLIEGYDMDRLRPDVRASYTINKDAWLEIGAATNEVHDVVRQFEEKHWLDGGVKNWYRGVSGRGWSGWNKHCRVMLWGCAGRVLLTIRPFKKQQDDIELTMIFSDESDESIAKSIADKWRQDRCCGGIQSVAGTKEQLLELAHAVVDHFPKLRPNKKVSCI